MATICAEFLKGQAYFKVSQENKDLDLKKKKKGKTSKLMSHFRPQILEDIASQVQRLLPHLGGKKI